MVVVTHHLAWKSLICEYMRRPQSPRPPSKKKAFETQKPLMMAAGIQCSPQNQLGFLRSVGTNDRVFNLRSLFEMGPRTVELFYVFSPDLFGLPKWALAYPLVWTYDIRVVRGRTVFRSRSCLAIPFGHGYFFVFPHFLFVV